MENKRLRLAPLAALLIAIGLFLGACGGGDNDADTAVEGNGGNETASSETGGISLNEPLQCDEEISVEEMLAYQVPKANEQYDITLMQVSLAAYYFQAMAWGGEQAADEAGVNFSLRASEGYQSPGEQLNQAQTVLAQNPDAIVIQPVDPDGSVPIVEQATAADVPVVDISTELNSPDAFVVMQDDYKQGQVAADAMAEAFPEGGKGIVQGGPENATWARKRVAGFQDRIAEKYPDLEILMVTQSAVDPAEGLQKFTDAVQANPDIDWIYAVNTALLLPDSIPAEYRDAIYIGGGLEPMIIDGLKSGAVHAAIPADQVAMGRIGVGKAVSILNGEDVPRVTCLPVEIVTKDDINGDFVQGELYPKGFTASSN